MLSIDSQIWIYYYDTTAKEHSNVLKWLDEILLKEVIILSSIIPIEIAHNLFSIHEKNKELNKTQVEEILLSLISLENCQLIDIDQNLIIEVINILKKYRTIGIGGRDALIIATMERMEIQTIATHDKNILSLKKFRRIDPVFDPPLILEIGEVFDSLDFWQKIEQIK